MIETVAENEIVTEEAAKCVRVKEEQFCASECDWLPPDQAEVKEFECYEIEPGYVPMDCTCWRCRVERGIKYCRNCPNYEIVERWIYCDKHKEDDNSVP